MTHGEAVEVLRCPYSPLGHFVGNHGVACYKCGRSLSEIYEAKQVLKTPQLVLKLG